MSQERARILNMVNEGQVTAQEAARLLAAVEGPQAAPEGVARWFRVRVADLETGRSKVNVTLPLSLVKTGLKLGARFSPEMDELDWNEILMTIQEGAASKIVEVENQESNERIEVFVE
jgi:hypothetical protein